MTQKKKAESLQYLDNKKPALWYFEWLDHCTHDEAGWKAWDNRPGIATILCIGWVMFEDEDSVYIVNNLDPNDGQHLHGQHIIKSAISKAVPINIDYDWEITTSAVH